MSVSGNTANSLCERAARPIPVSVSQENPPRVSGSRVLALGGRFAAHANANANANANADAGGRSRDVGWN